MLTYLENIDLFQTWIKVAFPAIQARSWLIMQFRPKAPGNSPIFLVWALSSEHIFFFSFRSFTEAVTIIPLGFCHLSLYIEKSLTTTLPLTELRMASLLTI